MDKNEKKKSLTRKIWDIIQGVGAICGIVISFFIIWNEITKPRPPELLLRFALNGKSSVLFAPTAFSSKKFNWNQPLPLGLLITNAGGTAADDAVLRLIHPTNLELSSKTIQISQQEIYMGPLVQTMTTIQLPSIHPGETLHFDKGLYTGNYNPIKTTEKAFEDVNGDGFEPMNFELIFLPICGCTSNDKKSSEDNAPIIKTGVNSNAKPQHFPATYEIEARISARNLPEIRTFLYITVGPIEALKNSKDPVFVINSEGNLYRYKQ